MSVNNDKKVKAARNIRELVAVKIEPEQDLQFDPMTFQQGRPMMADRNFLANQALLTQANRKSPLCKGRNTTHHQYSTQTSLFMDPPKRSRSQAG